MKDEARKVDQEIMEIIMSIGGNTSKIRREKVLDDEQHTRYRAIAARANYLAADRPDAQFSCKEACRFMAKPTDVSWLSLKRLGRYFVGRGRLVFRYDYQSADCIETYSDTDWAGCPRTRKSTSGGCLMLGSHILKTWSSTQSAISLSSGEAEFHGVVKASGVALGHQSLMHDLGHSLPVRVWTDSSAAMGVCQRQGLGRLRHIETQSLWVQDKVRTGSIELRKVRGDANPADLFTKYLPSKEKLDSLVRLFGCEFRDGRAASAPQLRRVDDTIGNFMYAVDQFEPGLSREAKLHDVELLPHHHAELQIQDLFPKAEVDPEIEEYLDYGREQGSVPEFFLKPDGLQGLQVMTGDGGDGA